MGFDPDSLADLSGRVYFVTGGNTGIGFYTVLYLAKKGARVYLGARSDVKGTAAIAAIKQDVPGADLRLLLMDLMDLKSVVAATKAFLKKETSLHGLINNAGIMAVDFAMTKDNYESQFQTNYLSHWVLTYHLLPLMIRTASTSPEGATRIVNLTSVGHRAAPSQGIDFEDINQLKGSTWSRYGQSKLANILHTKELSKRYGASSVLSEKAIWMASVHPGSVDTSLNTQASGSTLLQMILPVMRGLKRFMAPDEGSHTTLFAVASKNFTVVDDGGYFVPVAKKSKGYNHKRANDAELASRLWQWTEREMESRGFLS